MAYLRVYTQNMNPKITTDQKIDQIQEVLVDLVKLAGKTADDLSELKQDVTELKQDVADIQNEQERQGKKLDQIASFTHFTSGAFVA